MKPNLTVLAVTIASVLMLSLSACSNSGNPIQAAANKAKSAATAVSSAATNAANAAGSAAAAAGSAAQTAGKAMGDAVASAGSAAPASGSTAAAAAASALEATTQAGTASSNSAASALNALTPGAYSAADLVKALNQMGVQFDTGKSVIKPDSAAVLENAAKAIKGAPAGTRIEIGGYTDNTGSATANLRLSRSRAEAVMARLVKLGVPASMLTAKGYGEANPIASNSTAEGRAKNRRMEFSVLH